MRLFGWNVGGNGSDAAGVAVADPVRNRDSEVSPEEMPRRKARKREEPDETADAEMVMQRFREAAERRRPVEREWVLACAMMEGRQWLAWDDATHRTISLLVDGEEDRYVTDPLIRPLVMKGVALATMTKPDATPAPQSESPLDRAAAAEARLLCAHVYRGHGGVLMTQELATWAAVCGVAYDKGYWHPDKRADVPTLGPDGRVLGKRSLPVGDICRDVVPPFELYIDPGAKRWRDAGWVIHASVRPLSWFQSRYGERGQEVEPGLRDTAGLWAETYVTDSYGGVSALRDWFGGVGTSAAKRALCLELWEKPTPRFPEGRYIVLGGRTLLYRGPWPHAAEEFPFSRMPYQEAMGHPYGRGLVADLAPLQVAYNRLMTRLWCRVEDDVPTLLVAKGSGVGPDAYTRDDVTVERNSGLRKVYYDSSEAPPPQWQGSPPAGADVYRLRDIVWMDMQHIAGIHDQYMGHSGGATSGIQVELLQQGDRTQHGLFTNAIEQYAVQRDELNIALYAQFASPDLPRLMGLDDSGNPEEAQMRAQAFRALTAGGACKVIVTPGSASPRTPAAQQEEVLTLFRMGLLDPANPAAQIAMRLYSFPRSSEVLEMMRRIRAEAEQKEMLAAALQQAVMQQQQGPGGDPPPPGGAEGMPGMPPQGPGGGMPTMGNMGNMPMGASPQAGM